MKRGEQVNEGPPAEEAKEPELNIQLQETRVSISFLSAPLRFRSFPGARNPHAKNKAQASYGGCPDARRHMFGGLKEFGADEVCNRARDVIEM